MALGRVHDHAPAFAVGEALRVIPSPLLPLVACEFVIGVDPVFANVHHFDATDSGHHYSDVAHCVYDFHQGHRPASDRGTKIVLPTNRAYHWASWDGVHTVVHELGHVLHQRVGFTHVAAPVSKYAETNHYEAFAEAFAAWVWHERVDDVTTALLDGLR